MLDITAEELRVMRAALETNLIVANQNKMGNEYKARIERTIDKVDKLIDYCSYADSIGIL